MNCTATMLDTRILLWQIRPLVSVLARIVKGTLKLTTPEGYQLRFGRGGKPRADLQLTDWVALRRIFRNGDVGLAECYREGLTTSSDLTALMRLCIQNQGSLDKTIQGNRLLTLCYRIKHLLRFNSRRGSARNIGVHYDLGNDFYRLWLDPSMTYSSARFDSGLEGDLEQAQKTKYQRMVDFAGAAPGSSVLEIGCGWGGFAEYATKQGIHVHGVTVSRRLPENRSRSEGKPF